MDLDELPPRKSGKPNQGVIHVEQPEQQVSKNLSGISGKVRGLHDLKHLQESAGLEFIPQSISNHTVYGADSPNHFIYLRTILDVDGLQYQSTGMSMTSKVKSGIATRTATEN